MTDSWGSGQYRPRIGRLEDAGATEIAATLNYVGVLLDPVLRPALSRLALHPVSRLEHRLRAG